MITHKRHNIQGCVFEGANGLEIQDGSADSTSFKNYAINGNTSDIRVGERVKLHGTKQKHPKGSPGDQAFVVDKLNKDYGPCKLIPTLTSDLNAPDAPKTSPNTNLASLHP